MEKLRVGYEMANSWFDPPLVRRWCAPPVNGASVLLIWISGITSTIPLRPQVTTLY